MQNARAAFQVLNQATTNLLADLEELLPQVQVAVSVLQQACPRWRQASLFLQSLQEWQTILRGAQQEFSNHEQLARTPSLWSAYQSLWSTAPSPQRETRFLDRYAREVAWDAWMQQLYDESTTEP